jgi:hypothetical protein
MGIAPPHLPLLNLSLSRHRPLQAKAARSLKRSFMARFLEDDDEADRSGEKRSFLWRRGDERKRQKGVVERVFGICKADPKQGREGSSVIHPQSPFATGSPLPARPSHPMAPSARPCLLSIPWPARVLRSVCGAMRSPQYIVVFGSLRARGRI